MTPTVTLMAPSSAAEAANEKPEIDAMNHEEHGPAYGCRENHDSPPLAEYQPHE